MPEAFESLSHLTELLPSPNLESHLRRRWRTPLRYPALAAAVLLLAAVGGALAAGHGLPAASSVAASRPVPVVAAQVVGKTPVLQAAATAQAARPGEPAVITFPVAPATALTQTPPPASYQAAAVSGSAIVIQIQLQPGQSVTAAYLVLSNGTELAGTLQSKGPDQVSASFPQTSGHWQAVFVINGQAWMLKIPS
ncbi:MAG: hypothetical protein ACYCO4_03930 [Sulfobacillus sp.]